VGFVSRGRLRWSRRAAWLGVFALFLQTFLPLTQAESKPAEEGFFKDLKILCSFYGAQPQPLADGNKQQVEQEYSCPFCQIHAFAFVPAEGMRTSVPSHWSLVSEHPPYLTKSAIWPGFSLLTRGPPQTA